MICSVLISRTKQASWDLNISGVLQNNHPASVSLLFNHKGKSTQEIHVIKVRILDMRKIPMSGAFEDH